MKLIALKPTRIPLRAVLISLAALAIPLFSLVYAPEQLRQYEVLVWLLPLVPGFLWAYYRGWKGAAIGFAAAMAILTVGQVMLILMGKQVTDAVIVTIVISVSVTVALGMGGVSELLHRERTRALHLAYTDDLTGLPNRRHLHMVLDTEFAAAQRGRRLVLVVFDLDEFKRFNDRFGHGSGDDVLRAWGEILARTTRKMNLSARSGGEEFISIVSDATVEGALVFVDRARDALAAMTFMGQKVTVSVGVAEYDPAMKAGQELIDAADAALYQAKAEGRNAVRVMRGASDVRRV
jgi:diguanylate cyclase (GGDEF)-like protein